MSTDPQFNDWHAYLLGKLGEMYGFDPGKGDYSARITVSRNIRYGSVIRGKVSRSTLMVVEAEENAGWLAIVIAPGLRPDYRHRVGQWFRVIDLDKYEVLEA